MIFLNTTEQTLRIILGREDIKIKSVRTQETLKNLQGHSAILDMLYFFAIKEEHERQHSDQHHRAINTLFAKED